MNDDLNEWVISEIGGWMEGWIGELMDNQLIGWMDGWIIQ